MATVEELFEQFKQLPDWNLYPLPESFYQKFNIKKPKPGGLMESLTYQPPPHASLNKEGKIEIKPVAEGGVREIKEFLELPVEVKMITDESTDQTADDTKTDSPAETLTPPTEDSKTETLGE